MAKNTGEFSFDVRQLYSRRMDHLLWILNSTKTRTEVNKRIEQAIRPFVPNRGRGDGPLRKDVKIYPTRIVWGSKGPSQDYAHYQFMGHVYGPNVPGYLFGTGVMRSPRGKKKFDTGRDIGAVTGYHMVRPKWVMDASGTRKANKSDKSFRWYFGYRTPGTTHHWTKEYRGSVKMKANLEITKYLKGLCKAKGLSV